MHRIASDPTRARARPLQIVGRPASLSEANTRHAEVELDDRRDNHGMHLTIASLSVSRAAVRTILS